MRRNCGKRFSSGKFGVDFDSGELGLVDLGGTAEPFLGTMRNGI